MSKAPTSKEVRRFRRLCRTLGTPGTSERRKRERRTAFRLLKEFFPHRQRILLEQVWHDEEAQRRQRQRFTKRFLWWGMPFSALAFFALPALIVVTRQHQSLLMPLSPALVCAMTYTFLLAWSNQASYTQRGMARLILRQEVIPADVGRLLEMTEFEAKDDQERQEITIGAWRHLIRLLPTLAHTDEILLDDRHKQILRRWVTWAGRRITDKKSATFTGIDADVTAAALVALSATGGWRESDKEAQSARLMVKQLAAARARLDEPLNHQYVREVARESLAQVEVGQAR